MVWDSLRPCFKISDVHFWLLNPGSALSSSKRCIILLKQFLGRLFLHNISYKLFKVTLRMTGLQNLWTYSTIWGSTPGLDCYAPCVPSVVCYAIYLKSDRLAVLLRCMKVETKGKGACLEIDFMIHLFQWKFHNFSHWFSRFTPLGPQYELTQICIKKLVAYRDLVACFFFATPRTSVMVSYVDCGRTWKKKKKKKSLGNI